MLIARKVNPFWITVIQAYEDLSDRVDFNSASELLIEPLFLCIKFKITFYKVFHFKEWTSKNLFVAVVKHLLEEDGKCFNVEDDIRVQVLEYLGCINFIRAYFREHKLHVEDGHFKEQPKEYGIILNSAMRVLIFFSDILLGRAEISNACKNWEKMPEKDIKWTKDFVGIKTNREIKLRLFQTKICHIILVRNSIQKDTGVVDNKVCNF